MNKSLALLVVVLLASCGHRVRVKGCFAGAPEESVRLEIVSPSKKAVIDSTRSDSRGRFAFRVPLSDNQPTIYNIICKQQSIPLLLAPGESVRVSSIYGIGMNYTVKGSEGSTKLRDLGLIFFNGLFSLDSLRNLYTSEEFDPRRKTLAQEYTRTYYRIKREHIHFIVKNCSSIAAIYALYQRLPNDNTLIGGDNDMLYYRLVADSVVKRHPDSPYLRALEKEIESSGSHHFSAQNLNDIKAVGHPEIALPDMYGNMRHLSELDGKVVILLFWSLADSQASMMNAELKELYAEYAHRGLEIYQVCVDAQKAPWIDAVQRQRLRWINVCDLKGIQSPAARVYNVDRIPTCYVIDRGGDIVARNIFGPDLEKKIKELIGK
ncbi:hypothetical protein FACS1894159_02520 [Bacteroidia bacterium]|nr:hypothetical protein FACS1894159_02520 [Bacteroidia bacterium]